MEVVAALVTVLLVRAFLVQSFYVPSGSMENTVMPADRVLVDRLHGGRDLQRGDIVVFDGTTAFGGPSLAPPVTAGLIGSTLHALAKALGIDLGEKDYLKRVIGLPGDHVVCCDASGRLTVNGAPVTEPYVITGTRPSDVAFNVLVPAGDLWVMGDNRPASADSRAHLGDPGGGMVPLDDVLGRVVLRYWPPGRFGTIGRSDAFAAVPAAAGTS